MVQSSANHTLGANVEELTLTGSADLTGTGNADANVLRGNAGANVLDGGLGVDTLVGGVGDGMHRLGEHRARPGEREADELGDRESQIREECCKEK